MIAPRFAVDPNDKKIRVGANPGSIFNTVMTWTDASADCDGAWESGTPRQWQVECWEQTILPKLTEWQKLTWAEIDGFTTGGKDRHKMHHSMEVDILADEAIYRLIEIEKHGDTIFRFRLGSKRRLWGFRILSEFELVWYDPNHEIYPTEPG